MAKDKNKNKNKNKNKDKKLDVILEKLSRIESSIRKLSKQQEGVSAELSKLLSVLKTLRSRAASKEKKVAKKEPVPLRSVVVAKPVSGARE